MTERPHNIRAASILERSYGGGYNSRRLTADVRNDDHRIANRAYRGAHRADSVHRADDHSAAQQRHSRVGRHHAEHTDDFRER